MEYTVGKEFTMAMMTAEQAIEHARGLTFEKVWAMFEETDRKFQKSKAEHDRMSAETDKKFQEAAEKIKEAAEKIKETEALIKETAEQQKKTDAQMKKTDKQLEKVSKERGGIGNSLGDMTEGLLTTDLLERFKELGLDFDDAIHNITIRERGTKRKVAEVDWLLLNTTIALVGESKTKMTMGDVDKHLQRMKKLSGQQNNLIGGKKLYGAMAGAKINNKTKEHAKNKGLFVLEPSGDTVKIEAPAQAAVW
jgi:hypothetical protein